MHHTGFNNAAEMKACRKAAGWSQRQLADETGFHVCTVKYHEKRTGRIDGVAPSKFRKAFQKAGVAVPESTRVVGFLEVANARAPASDIGFGFGPNRSTREPTPWRQRKSQRPKCGARTRVGGSCKAPVVHGKNRCRMHGGLSTGPRTDKGRAAIAESNRRRARAFATSTHAHVQAL